MNIEQADVDSLHLDPANVRKHPDRNLDAIKASLARFGQQKPIVVDANNVVRAGNGTLAAAKALGWDTVAVVRTSLKGTEATAYAIADNRTGDLAEWDELGLAEQLRALQSEDFDLDAVGYTDDEVDALLKELADEFVAQSEEDEPPSIDRADELLAKWKVEPGQLWVIPSKATPGGEHRVLCGDSTKAEDVARVMGGEKADLCFTSPPYGAGKVAKLRDHYQRGADKRESFYATHDDDPDQWPSLMAGWFDAVRPAVHAVVCNVQMLADNKRHMLRWLAERADDFVDVIAWDKGHAAPQMQANVLSNAFEFMFVFGGNGTRSIPFAEFHGTIQNVVRIDPRGSNEFADAHRAVMPVGLPAWVFGHLCPLAKTAIDPFLGTGTTIVAAEQTGRLCRGIEIAPKYVAVILERLANLGLEPQLQAAR